MIYIPDGKGCASGNAYASPMESCRMVASEYGPDVPPRPPPRPHREGPGGEYSVWQPVPHQRSRVASWSMSRLWHQWEPSPGGETSRNSTTGRTSDVSGSLPLVGKTLRDSTTGPLVGKTLRNSTTGRLNSILAFEVVIWTYRTVATEFGWQTLCFLTRGVGSWRQRSL